MFFSQSILASAPALANPCLTAEPAITRPERDERAAANQTGSFKTLITSLSFNIFVKCEACSPLTPKAASPAISKVAPIVPLCL